MRAEISRYRLPLSAISASAAKRGTIFRWRAAGDFRRESKERDLRQRDACALANYATAVANIAKRADARAGDSAALISARCHATFRFTVSHARFGAGRQRFRA